MMRRLDRCPEMPRGLSSALRRRCDKRICAPTKLTAPRLSRLSVMPPYRTTNHPLIVRPSLLISPLPLQPDLVVVTPWYLTPLPSTVVPRWATTSVQATNYPST